MSILAEITEKLESGLTTDQLIKQGYKRSSVYRQAARLKNRTASADPDATGKITELERELANVKARATLIEEQNNTLRNENLQLARMLGQTENQVKMLTAPKIHWWRRLARGNKTPPPSVRMS